MPTLSDDEFLAQGPELEKQLEAVIAATPAVEAPIEVPAPIPETPAVPEPAAAPPPATDNIDVAAATPPTEGTVESDATPPVEPDYKAVYERLFGTPIRAGGQDITLQNPEEAINLIQKGVGFHNKMNRMQHDLKYVEMLRNNNLLDESKLSLLIDANSGKAGAIKKLLDSAKVDPLDLDSAEASSYAPSDHAVSAEQINFQTVVSDLSDSETGKAVLIDAQTWDQASKAEIFKTPAVLSALAEQKELGRYDLIVAELTRAKVLGQIPVGESFLQSYTRVGQQMMQAGRFGTPTPPIPTPVAQKIVTPPVPANSKMAAAAAPTRVNPVNAQPTVNINELDDDAAMVHIKKTLRI